MSTLLGSKDVEKRAATMGEKQHKKKTKGTPNKVDIYVAQKLRLRRSLTGVSQKKLAAAVGITFQQVQKYEKGTNRVGASRLQAVSKILQTPVEFFFEGAPEVSGSSKGAEILNLDNSSTKHLEFIATTEGIKLNRSFARIKNPKVRAKALELIKAMADADDNS